MKRVHYERAGTLDVEEGMRLIAGPGRHAKVQGYRVLTKGLRLATFLSQPRQCSSCGLPARYFAIERCLGERGRYHLNLYGVNAQGHSILMTHDHTLARSLGGANNLSNTTAMCAPCNLQKSKRELNILKAQRVAAGLDPHSGRAHVASQPDREEKRRARAWASLEAVAQGRGMTTGAYIQYCHEQGCAWQQANPERGYGRKAGGKQLGLSRVGYGFFRYDHDQFHRQKRTLAQT